MGLFGSSFEEQVQEAVKQLASRVPGIRDLAAHIEGKVVTLKGVAASRDVRNQVMKGFTELVKADSTVNGMTVDEPKAEAPKPAAVTAKADPPASATASAQSVVLAPAAPAAAAPAAAAPAAAAPAERRHVVVKGETLSAIAKQYYGKASAYPKIFEANRDILKDADHIQVGQSLRIPE